MFVIDSTIQKPNHDLMMERAQQWAERGFRFDRSLWKSLTDLADEKAEKLRALGLKKPDSQKEVTWFLRSFNSLEIASQLFELNKMKWDLSAEALGELAESFSGLPELQLLYEYRKIAATARSFRTLEKYMEGNNLVHPKVKRTVTNRILFAEPFISGLPKICKPFLPADKDSVLISVDMVAQEPTIAVSWFGGERLKSFTNSETDLYRGVSKAAFIPKVKAFKKVKGEKQSTHTEANKGIGFLRGEGDALLYMEDVYVNSLSDDLPESAYGVFESGVRMELPVTWGTLRKGKGKEKDAIVGEILPGVLQCRLTEEARQEVKFVWNMLTYGGSKNTAINMCNVIDAAVLADFLKQDILAGAGINKEDGLFTYFGTELKGVTMKRSTSPALQQCAVQGTGADILALLVEHFYSVDKPDGVDIYFTRYDEIVLECTRDFISSCGGGAGVARILRDIFEHKIDDFPVFKVDIRLFKEEGGQRWTS